MDPNPNVLSMGYSHGPHFEGEFSLNEQVADVPISVTVRQSGPTAGAHATPGVSEYIGIVEYATNHQTVGSTTDLKLLIDILSKILSRTCTLAEAQSALTDSMEVDPAPVQSRPENTSLFCQLPNELLLEITSGLGSKDLRLLRTVCFKTLNLTDDARMDRHFFRGGPQLVREIDFIATDVELHPVFHYIRPMKATVEEVIVVDAAGLPMTTRLMDMAVWNQMATNPPLRVIRIKVRGARTMNVSRRTGVRVCNIIQAIIRLHNKPDKDGRMLSEVYDRYPVVDRPAVFFDTLPHRFREWKGLFVIYKTRKTGVLVVGAGTVDMDYGETFPLADPLDE